MKVFKIKCLTKRNRGFIFVSYNKSWFFSIYMLGIDYSAGHGKYEIELYNALGD